MFQAASWAESIQLNRGSSHAVEASYFDSPWDHGTPFGRKLATQQITTLRVGGEQLLHNIKQIW
eukprot:scaffold13490_cov69-Attheya_sp.AAC.7